MEQNGDLKIETVTGRCAAVIFGVVGFCIDAPSFIINSPSVCAKIAVTQ